MTARLGFVTGHAFGCRAMAGILSAEAYLSGELEIPLVLGLSESHRGHTVGYESPQALAEECGAHFEAVVDGTLIASADQIIDLGLDHLLVIGWSKLVADEVLALPHGDANGDHRCIGMHPTPLPLGRGQAPIPWTIIKGLEQTALSVFELSAHADQGSLLAQYPLSVQRSETSASLFRRLEGLHFQAGFDLAGSLGSGVIHSETQNEDNASIWPKRRPRDGEIKVTMTRLEVDRLVRALLGPYPRAFVDGSDGKYSVERVSGTAIEDAITFECVDGPLWLVGATE